MILAWRCSPELTMNRNLPSMFRAFLGYTVICLNRKAKVFFCQLKFLHLVAQALDSRETPPGAPLSLPPGALSLPLGAPLNLPPGAPLNFPPGDPKTSPPAPKLFTAAPPNLLPGDSPRPLSCVPLRLLSCVPLGLLAGVPLRLLSCVPKSFSGAPKLVPGASPCPNIRSLTSRTFSS